VHSISSVDELELVKAIRKSILSLHGEIALADSRFYMNEYDSDTATGIFHCTLKLLEKVIAAAVLVYSVDKQKISIQPLKTSGTIKGVKK
jgi:RNase P/RNase MRP subunit POP5